MRLSLISAIVAFALTCLIPSSAHTQDSSTVTRVGLSAVIQGGQIDILIPILRKHFSLAPSFGFVWAQDGGTDVRFGLVPRFLLSGDKVIPYVGGRIGLLLGKPSSGPAVVDWLVGGEFGGEYFIDQHFSLGIESQLNLTISNSSSSRFGNPGKKNVNTAMVLFATVYF